MRMDLDTPYYAQLKETWARQLENAVRSLPKFDWELQPQLQLNVQQNPTQMQQNGANAAAQLQPQGQGQTPAQT
jgi:putative proteasome-type protease